MSQPNFLILFSVWVNDVDNEVAKEVIEMGLNQPPTGIMVKNHHLVESKETSPDMVSSDFCAKYNTMVEGQTPPDLIIDSTRSGMMSGIVKKHARMLGVPTLSMSYGQKGDLSAWSDLDAMEKKYLVQVRPPGDVVVGVIRQMIERNNISSAAILYDESFGKDT